MAQTQRMKRRVLGMLGKRMAEAQLGRVVDQRDPRGRRWSLGELLRSAVVGLVVGSKSLRAAEKFTAELTPAVRGRLGIRRRVPDTTLRDTLCSLEPAALRPSLHATVRAAQRRKALSPDGLPFGVISLDGKGTAVPSVDDFYAQRQTQDDAGPLIGVIRTVTSVLTSSRARPVLDVVPVPASTNEMGRFEHALDCVCAAYEGLDLFRLATYDAGACSKQNAEAVRAKGLHYLFGLKGTQPLLYEEAVRWLGSRSPDEADVTSEDVERGKRVVRRLHLGGATVSVDGWEHLRTVLRIESATSDEQGNVVTRENRYFVSSLPRSRLNDAQWLLVVRRHWGVETAHQILDTAFAEDDHPWIEQNPRATVVVMVLRRIAYNLLGFFRSVSLRSDEQRSRPWKELMGEVWLAVITATTEQLSGLRRYRLSLASA